MLRKQRVHKYHKTRTIVLPCCAELGQKMERCMSKLEHDLRGCVQLITGYADLAAEKANGQLEPQQLECLKFIKAGSKRVQDAVERGRARVQELVHPESTRR
jgi:light-regulated signal transduction histidine kinase (bacteriophytochrome)